MSLRHLTLAMLWTIGALCPLVSLAQVLATPGPTFDCIKARGRTEKMICSDPMLSQLDRRIADLFQDAQLQGLDAGDLKKSQRKWLRERDDCKTAECLSASYTKRLQVLITLTGKFPSSFSARLCGLFEQPDTLAQALASKTGVEDVNNDGAPEPATHCAEGTWSVPCLTDDQGKTPAPQLQGLDWNAYSAVRRTLFSYEGRTFLYHSHDAALTEPAFISFITPDNRELRVCDFETQRKSATVEGGDEVCAAVEDNDARIEAVELAEAADGTIALSRPNTRQRARGAVDIDNDGLDESVVELIYESGTERSCSFNYFELLAEDQQSLLDNSNSKPVRELQDLTDTGYEGLSCSCASMRPHHSGSLPSSCGSVQNRLFKLDKSVFYETNMSNDGRLPHEVRKLDGRAVSTLCTFELEVTTKVKTLF